MHLAAAVQTPRPRFRLAVRIAIGTLVVAVVAIALLSVGVLVIARSTFDRLMVDSGVSAATAQRMFDQSVVEIFAIAMGAAAIVSAVLSTLIATHLARPLDDISRAARRVAAGEYEARASGSGPAEMASLADSFNAMAASLADQERLRRDFIVNAAHELRTPLTNLQGYLEALRDGVVSPSREQFASLHEEVDRLVRLADSLDSLASSADGAPQEETPAVDLTKSIRASAAIARPAFDSKAISLDMDVPAKLRARGNPDRLAQVLANLLQNAARYTPPRGTVHLAAYRRRDRVTVAVANSGDGIPVEDVPHVFERFYRVEKSRDSARGGAGVGLAIVKQLVEAEGGEVGVDSRRGATRFWFTLPC